MNTKQKYIETTRCGKLQTVFRNEEQPSSWWKRLCSSNLQQCDIPAYRCVNILMCLQDKEKNINYGCVDDTYNIIYLRCEVIEFRVTVVKQEHLWTTEKKNNDNMFFVTLWRRHHTNSAQVWRKSNLHEYESEKQPVHNNV